MIEVVIHAKADGPRISQIPQDYPDLAGVEEHHYSELISPILPYPIVGNNLREIV